MSTEISPLQSVQDNIKNRIKAEFANLIPDETWSAMVKAVVEDFTSDTKTDSYGRTSGRESPMKAIIRQEIEELAKAAVKSELAKLDVGYWGQFGSRVANEAVQKLVAENFNAMLAGIQSSMVEMAVMTAVNNIRNSMMR